eukprot:2776088-Pleurochrysis_carterae.AAC.3
MDIQNVGTTLKRERIEDNVLNKGIQTVKWARLHVRPVPQTRAVNHTHFNGCMRARFFCFPKWRQSDGLGSVRTGGRSQALDTGDSAFLRKCYGTVKFYRWPSPVLSSVEYGARYLPECRCSAPANLHLDLKFAARSRAVFAAA